MSFVTIIILALVLMALFGAAKEDGGESPNWLALIGLIIGGGMLLATCASCG